MPYFIGNNVRK